MIPAGYEAESSRILLPAELLELHNRFQQMTADYNALPAGQKYDGIRPLKKETQLALWISLGTLCRIGELLQAEWKNVDLDRQTWFLPSENVKGTRGKNMSSTPPSPCISFSNSKASGEPLTGAFQTSRMMDMLT
ncbi:hypothetical protein D9M72_576000 [compost metagenome]